MKSIAAFLVSFNAVTIALLVLVGYRLFEVQFLFARVLPLPDGIRSIAASLVAIVVVFVLLIFSANIDQFKLSPTDSGNWIKWVLGLFTLLVNAYFWEVWSGDSSHPNLAKREALVIVFKISLSVALAGFDFSLNHLFIKAWNKSEDGQRTSRQLSVLKQLLADADRELSNVQASVSEEQAKVSQLIASQDVRTCPKCFKQFESVNKRNGHMRSCDGEAWKMKEL